MNTPLTHRDPFNPKDPTGTPDVVNLTYGLNVEVYRRSVLTFGFVTPVTGPRPFDFEFLLLFNRRFGGSRSPAPDPSNPGRLTARGMRVRWVGLECACATVSAVSPSPGPNLNLRPEPGAP